MHGETRQAYKLLVGNPAGVRPPGTPRCKWENNIKVDLNRKVSVNWINLAEYRHMWWIART